VLSLKFQFRFALRVVEVLFAEFAMAVIRGEEAALNMLQATEKIQPK
jgi:hypothetical protein